MSNTRAEDDKALETWNKVEEETTRRAAINEELNPSRRAFHNFAIMVSTVTMIAGLSMLLGQLLGIVFQVVGPIQYVLRLYVIILCTLVVLVEMEWTRYARDSTILRTWLTRGMFYTFIGVLGLEENDTSTARHSDARGFSFSLTFIKAVAWVMVICGLMYCAMGAICLQIVYNRQRADYEERLTQAQGARRAMQNYTDNAV